MPSRKGENILSIKEIKEALALGKTTERELFDECGKRAENSRLNAYITLTGYEKGKDGPLSGIPFAVKDNLTTRGIRTTAGSKALYDYVPFYDAFAVKKLKEAGAVILGKTNMDEFAMGSTGETSFFGAVKNPIDEKRVAGGSSSGSAAAVAEKSAVFALGTDTGGSVRLPAAFCSVVGLVPTYSLVSRYGLIAHASSLDRIGITAGCVSDAAEVLGVISAHDEADSSNSEKEYIYDEEKIASGIKNMRVGLDHELLMTAGKEQAAGVLAAADALGKRGATIVPVRIGLIREAMAAYRVISSAEASSNLLRYDGVRYGLAEDGQGYEEMIENTKEACLGAEVKKRIVAGCYFTSAGRKYLTGALNVRNAVKNEFSRLFSGVDVLLLPTAKSLPPLIGEKGDPDSDIFTVSSSLSGNPAVTVPAGDMVGVQLIGRHFAEDDILMAAFAAEEAACYEI